jgi:hypothetical protein
MSFREHSSTHNSPFPACLQWPVAHRGPSRSVYLEADKQQNGRGYVVSLGNGATEMKLWHLQGAWRYEGFVVIWENSAESFFGLSVSLKCLVEKDSSRSKGCSSVVQCLPSICEALSSILSTGGGEWGEGKRNSFRSIFTESKLLSWSTIDWKRLWFLSFSIRGLAVS